MSRVWKKYLALLEKHPWKTQIITTGVLFGTGDVISQQLVEKRGWHHDLTRTMRQASFGFFIGGPVLTGWYSSLDKIIKVGKAQEAALKKMALDQTVCAPTFIFMFFSIIGFMSGMSIEQVKEKINKNYWAAMKTNYKLWPAVQILNFYYVPLQHRVLVVNTVSLGWNTYLSWRANSTAQSKTDHVPAQSPTPSAVAQPAQPLALSPVTLSTTTSLFQVKGAPLNQPSPRIPSDSSLVHYRRVADTRESFD